MAALSLATPLADATFVVFDVETTGLDVTKGARIVEFGALKLRGGAVMDHFLTLVDPGVPVPPDAAAVHGLSDADLAGQPPIRDALPRFVAFAGDAVLVAHNLPFDLSFLAAAAREVGIPPPGNAALDLLGLVKHYRPGLASYSLDSLAADFALANPAPHRSLGDVAVESELLLAFLAAARERGDAATIGDWVLLSYGITEEGVAAGVVLELAWAAAARASVAVTYRGTRGESRRRVSPLRIKGQKGVGYLTAYCHQSRARRRFRLSRLALAAGEGGQTVIP